MKLVSVETPEKSVCKMTFSATAEELETASNAVYERTRASYTIKGFAKGEADRAQIEADRGEHTFWYDAINDLMDRDVPALYEAAMAEHGFKAVDEPSYDLVSVKKDEGFVATATTPLQPELDKIAALADTAAITQAARACKDASSALFVGRGMGAAIACEGALKLKEISYLHAEAYPAGEMKHGPIALIDEGLPVIAVATKSPVYDKLVSNLQEAKARGAMIVAVATEGDEDIRAHADHVVYIPKVRDAFSAVTASVPLQLFARAIAVERGCDVDQPRNLAKSVTVE